MSENLWGNLPKPASVKLPLDFLNEQGEVLENATVGVLRAMIVFTSYRISPYKFNYTFFLVATKLNNYRVEILEVKYDLGGYPVSLIPIEGASTQCDTPEEFKGALSAVLQSPFVQKTVSSLMAHSESDAHAFES